MVLAMLLGASHQVSAGGFKQQLTCAMYHRMEVGRLKSRGLTSMSQGRQEQMDAWLDAARQSADEEFGSAADSTFDRLWKLEYDRMMKVINSNYDNIAQLQIYYRQPCNPANLAAVLQ